MIRRTAIIFSVLGILGMASDRIGAQVLSLPPVSTDWDGPVILQNGEKPDAFYNAQIEHDGNGVYVAGWSDESKVDGILKSFIYLARSTDGGNTWSDPFALPDDNTTLSRCISGLAAGANGVWMAANITSSFDGGPPFALDVVISRDSGETWNEVIDVTEKFPPPSNSSASLSQFVVAYCGNSSWILVADNSKSVSYIRSSDNGVTWGSAVTLAESNDLSVMNLASHHNGSEVLITFADVSLFSTDNGQTFVPTTVNAVTGGTDGHGNWIVVGPDSQDAGLPVMHSEDHGATYAPIPGPPDTDLSLSPTKVIYTTSGRIIVLATAFVQMAPFVWTEVSGLFTITDDLGETWTSWERLHESLANTPIDMVGKPRGHLLTVFGLSGELQSYQYKITKPSSAHGWELYE